MPVTTTRCLPSRVRSTDATSDPLANVLHCIADGRDAFRILVGNLQLVLLFEGHDQLDEIQRIRPQIIEERRLGRDLVFFQAELLGDQLPYLLQNRIVAHGMDPPSWDQAVIVRPPSTTRVWPVI